MARLSPTPERRTGRPGGEPGRGASTPLPPPPARRPGRRAADPGRGASPPRPRRAPRAQQRGAEDRDPPPLVFRRGLADGGGVADVRQVPVVDGPVARHAVVVVGEGLLG